MRKIRVYGEDILRRCATEVKNIDGKTIRLIRGMKQTLKQSHGLGLSAPQVGISERIFIALDDKNRDRIITVINPEILTISKDNEIDMEGCLSFPEIYFSIQRAKKVILKGYNEKGKEIIIEAKGILARCFQHEMDHLDGKLIIDYATDEEKKFWKEKLEKLSKSS